MSTKLIVQYDNDLSDTFARRSVSNQNTSDEHHKEIDFMISQDSQPNEWDNAHAEIKRNSKLKFAEPNIDVSRYIFPDQVLEKMLEDVIADNEDNIIDGIHYDQFIENWPHPEENGVWHIEENFSQLKSAREVIEKMDIKHKIRIAHLDTGYDITHVSFPHDLMNLELSRNFVEDELEDDASDRFVTGMLRHPGHGQGTLSILAGSKMPVAGCDDFDDYVGLKGLIEVVPIRIATSVVLFKSSAFIKAMDYIVNTLNEHADTRIHIVSMSMGGLASKVWADLVNKAYDQGVFMVTAAGNNYMKLPTKRLVFPARFKRVVAACGVTYDYSPYAKPDGEGSISIMEGNHGPISLMNTALAAFTPNVPWAIWKNKKLFGIRGEGTSSATPQIAAAAALYYLKYFNELEALEDRYMIVEAIRNALFSTGLEKIKDGTGTVEEFFGNGILQAASALEIKVPSETELAKMKQGYDSVFLPFIRLIFGLKESDVGIEEDMLETELMQLALSDPNIQAIIDNPESDSLVILNREQRQRLALLLKDHPTASMALKQAAARALVKLEK